MKILRKIKKGEKTMKLMTNKKFQYEIEQKIMEENEKRCTSEHFDRLEKQLYKAERRIAVLEKKVRSLSGDEPKVNIEDKCIAVLSEDDL